MDKLWQNYWKLKFMKNQALELHSPLPKSFKVCKERKQREKSNMKDSRGHKLLKNFLELNSCMLYFFQSSGSQESNASNGVRFGVETKELQPLQSDHSKVLRNQHFVARISQPFYTVLWISS